MKKFIKALLTLLTIMTLIVLSWQLLYRVSGRSSFLSTLQEKGFSWWQHRQKGPGSGKKKRTDRNLDLRAVWVSYLEMADFRDSSDGTEEDFREFADHLVQHSKEMNFNCIIFQVRPFSDAFYDSEIFPWSVFISSVQGESPGYDPLAIMIETCRKYNMRIEAWINPYRIGTDEMYYSDDQPALKWILEKDRKVLHYKGMYYYNPSMQETRRLIADGVREIVSNYDVDGIHMDDYFYPAFSQDDVDTVFDAKEYKAGLKDGTISSSLSLTDWRRENVNALVRLLYQTVKEENSDITFGISPNGNPDLLTSDWIYYVDIDRWLQEEGFVDYIMPQIYWGYHNVDAPFEETVQWWEDKMDNSDVIFYVGLQVYKMGGMELEEGSGEEEEMNDPGLLARQIRTIDGLMNAAGYCVFSYQYLDPDNPCFFTEENKESSSYITLLREVEETLID